MTDVVVIGARKPQFSRRVPIGMAALLASAVLLEASPQEARVPATTASVRAASESSAAARDLDPATGHYGRRVTLRGVVGLVYGPQIFSLDDGTAGPGVLVVLPGELEGSVSEGLEVIVTGTARAFVDADVSRELGSLDAPPELVATLSRRPVVVARSVTRADGPTLLGSSGTETSATANGVVRGPTGSEVTRGVTGTLVTNGPTSTDVTRGMTGTDVTRGPTGTEATTAPRRAASGCPGLLWRSRPRPIASRAAPSATSAGASC